MLSKKQSPVLKLIHFLYKIGHKLEHLYCKNTGYSEISVGFCSFDLCSNYFLMEELLSWGDSGEHLIPQTNGLDNGWDR